MTSQEAIAVMELFDRKTLNKTLKQMTELFEEACDECDHISDYTSPEEIRYRNGAKHYYYEILKHFGKVD